jgi:CheY-like chemotaxis protein
MSNLETAACQVIVVDDNNAVLKAVVNLYARFGYAVREARYGREALEHFVRAHSDLVLSDLDMPDLTGLQLAQRIKQIDARAKVVIMTGRGQDALASFRHERVVDGWLFKPFDLSGLSRIMTDLSLPDAFKARRPHRPSRAA